MDLFRVVVIVVVLLAVAAAILLFEKKRTHAIERDLRQMGAERRGRRTPPGA